MVINWGILFNILHYNGKLTVLIRMILMSTHNIQFHDEIENFPKYLFSRASGRISYGLKMSSNYQQ